LLFWDAVALALRYGCSVYDSLYIALAERIDGRVVTADRRLVNLLAGTAAAGRVAPIEEWSAPGAPGPAH
jgi:predicted nucleic acid-binding protein